MVVSNHHFNAANQSKAQFQLELSLAQFSPSLFFFQCAPLTQVSTQLRGSIQHIRRTGHQVVEEMVSTVIMGFRVVNNMEFYVFCEENPLI